MGSVPKAPNFAQTYQQGIDVYNKNVIPQNDMEQKLRATFDPQSIQHQQDLQAQFGPTQYAQQLDALHQLDPQSQAVRDRLSQSILGDLNSGYSLPPEYQRFLEQDVRGAQAARGNILGNGAAGVESQVVGKAGLDLYQQHLANAGNFLAGPTPEGQINQIAQVSPDRSAGYGNPTAGYQGVNAGLANYSNILAQQQIANGQPSAWQGALGGAAAGAQAGSAAGGWGAVAGGIIGGIGGYLSNDKNKSSDIRLKTDIHHIATTNGIPLVSFRYLGSKVKHIGTIAQDVAKVRPDAVGQRAGFLTVNYCRLSLPFFALRG